MNKLNQKANTQLLVLLLTAVAIVAGVYLVQQRTNFLPKATTPYNNQVISIPDDLSQALNDLETTDLNQLDQGISENSTDANSF